MALAVTIRGNIADATDTTTYTSNTVTPTSDVLYVICFSAQNASSIDPADPTVVWNSISATKITSFQWDTVGTSRRKMWIYALNTGTAALSAFTITFPDTSISCTATGFEVTGSDVVNGVTQCFVQTATTAANPVANTTDSITLAAASYVDNRPFSVWHNVNAGVTSPRASWTEIGDGTAGSGTDATNLETQWRSDTFETTASATWGASVGYGGIAFEIKEAGAGGVAAGVIDPMGMRGFFGA